jgi:hypothetical protein
MGLFDRLFGRGAKPEYGPPLELSYDPVVTRTSLARTCERWPAGIDTNADASELAPPLVKRWESKLDDTVLHSPAPHRDMVIVAVRVGAIGDHTARLVGIELSQGRTHWSRPIVLPDCGLVCADGAVLVTRDGTWHAFDVETGAPRIIEVTPALRDALVVAGGDLSAPDSFCDFLRDTGLGPTLLAADERGTLYRERDARITMTDWGDTPRTLALGEVYTHCLTARHAILGTDEGLVFVDRDTAALTTLACESPGATAIGSDYLLVVHGGQRLVCYGVA